MWELQLLTREDPSLSGVFMLSPTLDPDLIKNKIKCIWREIPASRPLKNIITNVTKSSVAHHRLLYALYAGFAERGAAHIAKIMQVVQLFIKTLK